MGASESSEPVVQPPPITDPPPAPSQPPPVQPPPAPTATQTTPLPPVPEIPPQPTIPPPPPPVTLPLPPKLQPLPIEQRCIACLNYHYHDHPSVKGESAGAITVKNYPDDSPRLLSMKAASEPASSVATDAITRRASTSTLVVIVMAKRRDMDGKSCTVLGGRKSISEAGKMVSSTAKV